MTNWVACVARGSSLILRSPPSPNCSQAVFQILRSVVVTATDKTLLPSNFLLSTFSYISSANSFVLTISVCVVNHRWSYCLSLPLHTHTHTHTHTHNKCQIWESASVSNFHHSPESSAASEFCHSSFHINVSYKIIFWTPRLVSIA